MDEHLVNYRALIARVDAHKDRVQQVWSEQLACRRGCSGCCHRSLSVFPVEAAAIRSLLAAGGLSTEPPSPDDPVELIHPLTVLDPGASHRCAFLDDSGACRIYKARPLICRSHGLPVAVRVDGELQGDTCPLNYREGGLENVSAADFLDLDVVNTALAVVNAAFAEASGCEAGQRVELGLLAAEAGISAPDGSPGSS